MRLSLCLTILLEFIIRAMKFVLRKIIRYLHKMRNGIKQFRFVIQ